jgi:tetratricopeptide (TPR) repeat protein
MNRHVEIIHTAMRVISVITVLTLVVGCAVTKKQDPVPAATTSDAIFRQALRQIQDRDLSRAIDTLDKVIAATPDDGVALYNRGYCFQQTGKFLNAQADYSAALEIDADMVQAACNRGTVLYATGQKEEARTEWNMLVQTHPDYAPVYYNLGIYYLDKRQYERAVREFSHAIDRDPSMSVAFVNRANCYLALGKNEEAVRDFCAALRLEPGDAQIYFNRAVAWDEMTDYDQAISDYTKAVEFAPDFAAAYYNRGILYMRLGGNRLGCADMSQACTLGLCDRYKQLQKMGECPLDADGEE